VGDAVSFHPTLAKALEKRAAASAEFRAWANELIERWKDAEITREKVWLMRFSREVKNE
jgi:hypothetical protein